MSIMEYDFNKKVERSEDICWLKDTLTPLHIKKENMIGYSGAEFEFPTCPAFRRGVTELAQKGLFGYTLSTGKYKERCCWWMKYVRETDMSSEWLITTHGTIFSLATTIRMYTKPGENIIVLTPGYHRYEQAAVRLHRGVVKVPLTEKDGQYSMNWSQLEIVMSQIKNKILVLCNPNNPTGNYYNRLELEKLDVLSRKYQVLIFSDEIFADIIFEDTSVPVYARIAEEDSLAISCTSAGKTFSLTGVNHANVWIKNPKLREQFIIQRDADHYGSLDPMVCAGLISAYTEEGKEWLHRMKQYVWENYLLFASFMKEYFPNAVVTKPQGTYVVWVDYKGPGYEKEQLQHILVEEGWFIGDEGEEYDGKETCYRYSLAVPRGELIKSLQRLETVITKRKVTEEWNCGKM